MSAEGSAASRLFSSRSTTYDRFIRAALYPQGLRAFFRRSPLLRSGMSILEPGCGSGALTLAIRGALAERRLTTRAFHGFDLTPAMLDRLRARLQHHGIADVTLAQADVLRLHDLPTDWAGYDLIASAAMLEYVPRERLPHVLRGLRGRLAPGGRFVLFITRRSWLMQPLIGRWWRSNLYSAGEVRDVLSQAGFRGITFHSFPPPFWHLDAWGHIAQAGA
jgi:cyclopropane fatty-acyl-phospholipid synthase-like methyltransferase